MTLDDFEENLGRYGGDLAAWPDHERTSAELLLAASPDASFLFQRVARFDRLFDPAAVPPPPSVSSIVARATARPRLGIWEQLRRSLGFDLFDFGLVHAGALAACLAIGIAVGLTNQEAPASASLALLDLAMGAHVDQIDE